MSVSTAIQPTLQLDPEKIGGKWPLVKLGNGVTARLMEITPELAESWLKKNPRVQRNMSQAEVDMLVRGIATGEWLFNGATIVFGSDGRLYDGQHRLAACVKSGKSITSLVVYGVDKAAFASMDVGRARRPADALRTEGFAYVNQINAACQTLYRYEHNLPLRSQGRRSIRLSPAEILLIVKAHKGLEDCGRRANPLGKVVHNTGVTTAAMWLFERKSKEASAEFFAKLASGENLEKGSPILMLRNKIMPERLDYATLAHMMFQAWNTFRAGETFRRFEINTSEPLTPVM